MKNTFTKLFCALMLIAITGAIAVGCKKDKTTAPQRFPITVIEGDHYTLTVPADAAAGEEVTVEVKITDYNYHIAYLIADDELCQRISGSNTEAVYSFIMPARPVKVVASVAQDILPIVYNHDLKVWISGPDGAVEGATVDFAVFMRDKRYRISAIDTDPAVACDLASSERATGKYNYRFTMPASMVVLQIETKLAARAITLAPDERTTVEMLNCLEVGTEPDGRTYEAIEGDTVCFRCVTEYGYVPTAKVLAGSGAEIAVATEKGEEGECLAFVMPDEAVRIETTTDMLYKDKPFVGTYKGYYIDKPYGATYTTSRNPDSMEITLTLNADGTFSTSGRNNISGLYAFNESDNTFARINNDAKQGEWDVDGQVFYKYETANYKEYDVVSVRFYIDDITTDSPSQFIAANKDFHYCCITTSNFRLSYCLIEQADNYDLYKCKWRRYFLMDRTPVSDRREHPTVERVLIDGTIASLSPYSISNYLKINVGPATEDASSWDYICRFSRNDTGLPFTFTLRGAEGGYFIKQGCDSLPRILLDGFDRIAYEGTIPGETGNYTIADNILSVKYISGKSATYRLDMNARTFEEITE